MAALPALETPDRCIRKSKRSWRKMMSSEQACWAATGILKLAFTRALRQIFWWVRLSLLLLRLQAASISIWRTIRSEREKMGRMFICTISGRAQKKSGVRLRRRWILRCTGVCMLIFQKKILCGTKFRPPPERFTNGIQHPRIFRNRLFLRALQRAPGRFRIFATRVRLQFLAIR